MAELEKIKMESLDPEDPVMIVEEQVPFGWAAEEVLLTKVGRNVDILENINLNLDVKSLLNCRRVCSLWNTECMRSIRKQKSQIKVSLYAKNLSTISKSSGYHAVSLHEFVSKIPEDQRDTCIFRYVTFTFRKNPYSPSSEAGHSQFIHNFGWMISSLEVCVKSIYHLMDVLEYCKNVKNLTLQIKLVNKMSNDVFGVNGERRWNHLPYYITRHIAVDDNDYTELRPSPIVLEHLDTLDMSYNVQWGFGQFLSRQVKIPNLTSLRCTDTSYTGFGDSVVGDPRDPHNFPKQLFMMSSGQLKVIEYNSSDPWKPLPKALLKLDLSALTSIQIPFVTEFFQESYIEIDPEFYLLLSKVAGTLESLVITNPTRVFVYVDEGKLQFPLLPKVKVARIPHCVVNSPTFFAKLPSMQQLAVEHRVSPFPMMDVVAQRQLERGFFVSKLAMWRADSGWHPHQNLTMMEMEIGKNFNIPTTFPLMFPKLKHLEAKITKTSILQLRKLLSCMTDHETLTSLTVSKFQNGEAVFCESRPTVTTDLKICFVLMGLGSDFWEDVAGRLRLTQCPCLLKDLDDKLTESSLSGLLPLRKFTLKGFTDRDRHGRQKCARIFKHLDMYCFSRMPLLKEKHVV